MGEKKLDIVMAVVIVLIIAFMLVRGTQADSADATQTLQDQGYSNVQILEKKWLLVGLRGCSGDDAAKFTAQATNPTGQKVKVLVCTGWPFKGGTVRSLKK